MTSKNAQPCLTCYGSGELATESGPRACPDCFGEGTARSQHTKMEWRLRELEQAYRHSGRETEADVLWLIHEVRRNQETLMRILARCQDASDSDAVAQYVRYQANDALGLYEASADLGEEATPERPPRPNT